MAEPQPAPIAYREGSAAAAVRDWVADVPAWSIFKLSDAPGPRDVVAKTLSQMAARDPLVERVARGIYMRVDNPGRKGMLVYDRGRAAMAVAGPGSGYGALTAVNKLGWNWHPTVRLQICVVGRAPRSSVRLCEFLARSNEARRELTWAEVTVLEAVRFADYASWDWETCVAMVAEGAAATRLGAGAYIRGEALAAVGESERRAGARFRQRLRELTASLRQTVSGSMT